jgi:hypothetical protein
MNYKSTIFKILIMITVIAFTACGGGGSEVQQVNGLNSISADSGGVITYNNSVKIIIPAESLFADEEIEISPVAVPPSGGADTLLPAGDAYRFTPAGTTFNLSKPAVMEYSYNESFLAEKGFSPETLELFYYDETLNEYVAVPSYVDTAQKKIIALIEHFTIYMPMAKSKLASNNKPVVSIQNTIPNPVRANAPIYVRASVRDYDGSIAGVKVYFRKLYPTVSAWEEAIMNREVRADNIEDTYGFLIPANFLKSTDLGTGNDIEFYVVATDNLGSVTTSTARRLNVTRTYNIGSLNISPNTLDIAAGFERYLIARGVDNAGVTFQLIPESFSLQLGKGSVKNSIASGIFFHAAEKTEDDNPEKLIVNAGADTANCVIKIHSGELKKIEILDTNGNKIAGDIILSRDDVYDFDAVGYDEFGNTIEIFPSWSVDSYLGTINASNDDLAGQLTASGVGTGEIRINLGNYYDVKSVMVRPRLLSADPAANAVDVPVGNDIRLIFTDNIDPSTVDSDSIKIKRLEGTVEYDVIGKLVIYNNVVFFVPDSSIPLQQYTNYKVEVTGNIKEYGGTPVTPFVFTFRTIWLQGSVTYYGNGNDGGTVPVDSNVYGENDEITVFGNTGSMTKNGYNFAGWSTAADGSGTGYVAGQTFNADEINKSLYAVWVTGSIVTYNGNGSTSGNVPVDINGYGASETVTVKGNIGHLLKVNVDGASYKFVGWNSQADGNGVDYGTAFTIGDTNVTLYAKWVPYSLRDRGPAGGWICFIAGDYSKGWRYIEAAPGDLSSDCTWEEAINGCATYSVTKNGIVYKNWAFPIMEVMIQMYNNLRLFGVGNFVTSDSIVYGPFGTRVTIYNSRYWGNGDISNPVKPWGILFSNGNTYENMSTSIKAKVRPVRLF